MRVYVGKLEHVSEVDSEVLFLLGSQRIFGVSSNIVDRFLARDLLPIER